MKQIFRIYGVCFLFLMLTLASQPGQSQSSEVGYFAEHISIEIDLANNGISNYALDVNMSISSSEFFNSFVVELPMNLYNYSIYINGSAAASRQEVRDEASFFELTPSEPLTPNSFFLLKITGLFNHEYTQNDEGYFQFLFNWDLSLKSSNIQISLLIPKFAAVVQSSQLQLFPQTDSFASNGERIQIIWDNLFNTGPTNTILFVYYETSVSVQEDTSTPWQFLAFLLLILWLFTLIIGIFFYRKLRIQSLSTRQAVKSDHTKVVTSIKPIILSPQELDILKLISQYESGVHQSDLVDLLNLSRARVSQFLSSFETRGLIHKHKVGRQNYITVAAELVLNEHKMNDES